MNTLRKVIQITCQSPSGKDRWLPVLYALCDDGTMWSWAIANEETYDHIWRQIDAIPQPRTPSEAIAASRQDALANRRKLRANG